MYSDGNRLITPNPTGQGQPLGSQVEAEKELNLLPPAELTTPLWRSLLGNLRDRFLPQQLPPLAITSRPVDVGMLVGDLLNLPWYRTVFTNLGDVVTPETLPPLELESRPVDVGELIGDQLGRPWWSSLLRNLADAAAPERLPPLELTSKPVKPQSASEWLLVPAWSSVIDTPKVFLPDRSLVLPARRRPFVPARPLAATGRDDAAFLRDLTKDKQRALRRAHLREALWISLAAAEVVFLVVLHFGKI